MDRNRAMQIKFKFICVATILLSVNISAQSPATGTNKTGTTMLTSASQSNGRHAISVQIRRKNMATTSHGARLRQRQDTLNRETHFKPSKHSLLVTHLCPTCLTFPKT